VTLEELNTSLPNGFHDAELTSFRVDYLKRELVLDLNIWLGGMDE